jgi:hypothetical protein
VSALESIAIAGSAASVVSAAAAWAAVRQLRESVRESRRPRLIPIHLAAADGTVQFMIVNAGAGVAIIPHCAFQSSGRFMFGLIGEGMIRSGEAWRLRTSVPSTGDTAEGVVWCENTAGEFFVWSLNEKSERWPSRPSESPGDTFARFYPDATIDLETAVIPGQGMAFEPVKY